MELENFENSHEPIEQMLLKIIIICKFNKALTRLAEDFRSNIIGRSNQ